MRIGNDEYRAMLDRGDAAELVDVALVDDAATIRDEIKHLETIGVTDLCASSSARSPEPLSERSISWVRYERPRAPQLANLGSGRPFTPCPLRYKFGPDNAAPSRTNSLTPCDRSR